MYSKICIIHVIPPPPPQYVFFAEFPIVIYPLRLKSVHLFQLSSVVYILRAFLKYTKSLICCEFCCLSINRYKIILQIILKILTLNTIYTLYYISVKIWDEGLFWDEWSNWDEPSKNKRRFAMYRSLKEENEWLKPLCTELPWCQSSGVCVEFSEYTFF